MEEKDTRVHWDSVYRDQSVESLPWYHATLDPDVDEALGRLRIRTGRVLDLGTGPGTQAIALARIGFSVTAIDVSAVAIEKAQKAAEQAGIEAKFLQDDIVNSQLRQTFDCILDRGCFHVLAPEQRPRYVQTVSGLLGAEGVLLLKCFSHQQPGTQGPHRFRPEDIRALFSGPFEVLSIRDTVYHGPLEPPPQALFCVLRRVFRKTSRPQGIAL